ncbi:hypothetical protein Mal64_34220 [Pseudobythopirellula maris]|uniref:Uncharacterized protein n=1 Tax=Pseudobythopirellula maris TaxID=2527991 RepID=A0A5C5ZHL6_9BACT|nr:hypothetical protein [Pseudobythopirellula maris]TWT86595.1 hypothetical protein Mal64_34220 [Pseudobythopirellula maris]
MSTLRPTHGSRNAADHTNNYESMTPREQLLGMFVVLLVLLLAVVLKSL